MANTAEEDSIRNTIEIKVELQLCMHPHLKRTEEYLCKSEVFLLLCVSAENNQELTL